MQQLWTVLGPDGSKYVIWLGVGLALLLGVALVVWLLMKIFGRSLNLSGGNGRGQPQRLGITGAFNVDRKGRKLVIVRRDNVEHLILIGGPNDVLVESSIIRAERGARPAATAPEAYDAPAPQSVPAPVLAPQPAPKPLAPPVAPQPAAAPMTPPAPPRRDPAPVAAPAVSVAPPVAKAAQPVQVSEAPRNAPAPVTTEVKASEPVEIKAQSPAAAAPATQAPVIPAPAVPAPAVPAPVAPEPAHQVAAEVAPPRPATDPRLSDMARRLQSVLQRPLTQTPRPAVDAAAAAAAETKPIPLPSAKAPEAPAEAHPPVAAKLPKTPKAPAPAPEPEKPVTQGKDLPSAPIQADPLAIDSLEEEMARLLGRPGPGKH